MRQHLSLDIEYLSTRATQKKKLQHYSDMNLTSSSPFSFPYLSGFSIIELLPLHRLIFLCNFRDRSGGLSSCNQSRTTPEKPTTQTTETISRFSICTDELESYLITLLLAFVEAAIGPALHMFASVFGVRTASVCNEELRHVETAKATLIGGAGGRVCILGVAETPSAAKFMAVSKSELRYHNFPPEVITEHRVSK